MDVAVNSHQNLLNGRLVAKAVNVLSASFKKRDPLRLGTPCPWLSGQQSFGKNHFREKSKLNFAACLTEHHRLLENHNLFVYSMG